MTDAKNKCFFAFFGITISLLLFSITTHYNVANAQCFNVALYKPATGTGPGSGGTVPGNAFDDKCTNSWNSGARPTQSIQVDLQGIYSINNIDLIVAMTPNGSCKHNIYTAPGITGPWTLVDGITGNRYSGEKLERCYYPPLDNVGAIKVETVSSPSWVAWSEIGVYSVSPVVPAPTITASGPLTICEGDSVVLTSSYMQSYSWSNGSSSQSITVKTSGLYCVTLGGACLAGTQACNICSAGSACMQVNVIPKPTITAAANPICARTTTTLYANGGGFYQWSTGDTTPSVVVSPHYTTTTYTVTVSNSGCVGTSNITVVPLVPPAIEAGPNVAICEGSAVQLNASGGRNYSWEPATGLSNTSISNPVASPTVTTIYYTSSPLPVNTNIITNGNFEQGYVGFQSSYTYQSNLQPEATFYVGRNPRTYHPSFSPCTDHTSGSGNMMIVNASGTPGVSVWCQTIAIAANTDYDFSTWAASVHPTSPAILQFSINGQMMGAPFNLSGTTCAWSHFFATWNSGSSTTANICIVNQNTALSGNDFALDDIYFSPICYSMDSVVVTIKPIPETEAGPPQTICFGQTATLTATGAATYQWSTGATTASINVTPAVTTTYTVTGTLNACSKSDQVVVSVTPNPTVSISASANPICAGDSILLTASGAVDYLWGVNPGNGNPVKVAPLSNEIFSVTGTTSGCSSMASIFITVNPVPEVTLSAPQNPVCRGKSTTIFAGGADSYIWSDSLGTLNALNLAPDSTTTYSVTGTSTGCSDTASITIKVNPVYTENNPQTICNGQVYSLNTHNYTLPGTYIDTLYSIAGCDSVILTQLTVNPVFSANVSAEICDGNSYIFPDGTASTVAAVHTSNLITIYGCDSIIITALTVNPIYSMDNPQTICDGQTYSFNSNFYTLAGIYYDTLTTIKGCDSVIITRLTVNPVYSYPVTAEICSGDTYIFPDGSASAIPGIHTSNLTTAAGCDSIIRTTLTVNPVYTTNNPQTICSGQAYSLNAHNYTLAGIYYDTLFTMKNCDSIIITVLNVNPVYTTNNPQTICNGETYSLNAHNYTIAGIYFDTLTTIRNCDSVIITQLTVNPVYTTNNPQSICNGQIYSFNSHNYTTAGIYYDTLTSIAGCDSVIATRLIVNPVYSYQVSSEICDGNTYIFPDGSISTVPCVHTSNMTTVAGCDSIVVTTLTVDPVYITINPQTICNGQAYSLNTHTYTIAGTFYDTLSTIAGCDSVIVTLLTVNPVYFQTVSAEICNGGTYIFPDGTSSVISSVHLSHLLTVNGCDSIIQTNLTVNPTFNINHPISICNGQTYTLNSHNYTLAGIYYDTLTTTSGCDSVIITRLTVNPVYNQSTSVAICYGETYFFPDGMSSSIATTHTSNLLTVKGCDSIITTTLSINPVYSTNNPQTICNGQTYSFNSHNYTTAGIYRDTLFTIAGCDSVIVTQLTVNPVYHQTIQAAICMGETYIFPDGTSATASSVHSSNLQTFSGCDSIIVTTLIVNPVYITNNPQSVCEGQTYSLNSHNYFISGTYFDTLSTIYGCDSVINTILTVNPVYSYNASAEICNRDIYTFPDGTTSSVATVHMSNLTTVNSCDSIITTSLAINPVYSINNPQTICNGQTYSFNSHVYTTPGNYYDTLTTFKGCDSVIVTILTVNPVYSRNVLDSVCNGDTYIFPDGTTSTIAATHTSNLITMAGCDSIILTTLIVNPVYITDNPQTICDGQTYSLHSHNYTTAGIYNDTLLTISGCDSVIVTTLTVNPVYHTDNPQTICDGKIYFFNSHNYTLAGIYFDTLITIAGCDSVIVTRLTVNPVFRTNNPQTICSGFPYIFNSHFYFDDGTYYDTLTTVLGCDSIIVTLLTVTPNPMVSISASANPICNGDTTELTASGASVYSWSDGLGNDNPVAVDPDTSTAYTVTGTLHGCTNATSFTVKVNPIPQVTVTPGIATICEGDTVELLARGATSYEWDPAIGLSSATSAGVIAHPLTTSTFLVTGTSLGCSKTASVTINVNPLPVANFIVNPSNVSIFKPVVHFQDESVGSLPLSWRWSLGNGDSSSIPEFDYTYRDTGRYKVTLWVYNQYGCVDSVHDYVIVHPDYTIFIPNAFTPNNDMKNDLFHAYGTGISEFNMKIFDRWGELLYQTNKMETGWDGKYKGSMLPKGIYIYYIYFTDVLKTEHYRSGTVTIL